MLRLYKYAHDNTDNMYMESPKRQYTSANIS